MLRTTAFIALLLLALVPGALLAQDEAGTENPVVVITTSMGAIEVELFPDKAPLTVENFLRYVDEDFYSGTIFHRVMRGFMIQGGGQTADMQLKPNHGTIKIEADNGLSNSPGTIAMARKPDPHSATTQFFINTVNNAKLNHRDKTPRGWGYTVFGRVVSGMDVAHAIEAAPVGVKNGRPNVPIATITIESVRRK